jgi:aminoglycoside 6'-N-acetyltransferase
MSAYRFRPFTAADLPMAARGLRTPELVHWRGDAEEQIALIREDLGEPLMRQWIVEHAGLAFAYLQAIARMHGRNRTSPTFLREPRFWMPASVSQPCWDVATVAHSCARLPSSCSRKGAPVVAIDPGRDNHRARRACARAGCIDEEMVET